MLCGRVIMLQLIHPGHSDQDNLFLFPMKKRLIFSPVCLVGPVLISLVTWSGCAINHDETHKVSQENLSTTTRPPGIYPDTVRLFDIVGRYPETTWKDLDLYYRNDIPKYHAGMDYADNLKKLAISHLVYTFQLTEHADKKTLEFYVLEQTSMPIPNAEVLINCLEGLKGYWPDARIRATALSEYERLIDYVNTDMKDPEGVLLRHKHQFDKLKEYGEHNR